MKRVFCHELAGTLVLGWSLDSAPKWKGWYGGFGEDHEFCGVLGFVVDDGDCSMIGET
jgi:hypothetical protein